MKEERGNGKPDQVDVLKDENISVSLSTHPSNLTALLPLNQKFQKLQFTQREREKSQRMLDLDFFWRMLLRAHDRRCCLQRME